ncbi:MAG: hypothetical protein JWQ40_2616 [Segetibacter sp.]|jgi:uncharacterized membrane protein|nr:hypothetical protein [Segetibacter sp.]
MTKRWSGVEKMLVLSVSFTMFLLVFRLFYWGRIAFTFYPWNFFLAIIPLLLSRTLYKWNKLNVKSITVLLCWLLFLPNAPYIITDIFHFREREPVTKWYDLLLVTSAAWNGLIIGIVSLLQVEEFLQKHLSLIKVRIAMFISIIACSFGIYLGRFLRFNSWDIFTNTDRLMHSLAFQFLHPQENIKTWAFTVLFAAMLALVYYTIKNLAALVRTY